MTVRQFNNICSSLRFGCCCVVLRAAELADVSLDDGAVDVSLPGGFFPPSLKPPPSTTGFLGFLSSEIDKSSISSTPVNAFSLSFKELRANHQFSTVSFSSRLSWNEGEPVLDEGLALKSRTRRRSNPKIQDAAVQPESSVGSWRILIAKGWLQMASALGPKTTESSCGCPSSLLYVMKATPGKRFSMKLSARNVDFTGTFRVKRK
mmetsp:Transcript_15235/g.33346  ORF Transcript_15235/g.33346 Transcript_15235/m.33346 type:complete len:206 (+) Transcript_15235:509-1126(+)